MRESPRIYTHRMGLDWFKKSKTPDADLQKRRSTDFEKPPAYEGEFSEEQKALVERAISEVAERLRRHFPLERNPATTDEKLHHEAEIYVMRSLSGAQKMDRTFTPITHPNLPPEVLERENEGGRIANKNSMIQLFKGTDAVGMSEAIAKELVEKIILKEG